MNPATTTDTINISHPDDWKTSEYASIFEITRVIGIRATQIQNGAQPYVAYTENDTAEVIARREIHERRCPLSVIRKVANVVEVIPINSLIVHIHVVE